jgi:hypothetical protein
MSHNLTVPSPEPEARFLESGLKFSDNTASVWPYMLLEDLVIGLTLNSETG